MGTGQKPDYPPKCIWFALFNYCIYYLLEISNIKIGELGYRIVTENLSRMCRTLDLISSSSKMKIKINHTKNNEVIGNT